MEGEQSLFLEAVGGGEERELRVVSKIKLPVSPFFFSISVFIRSLTFCGFIHKSSRM